MTTDAEKSTQVETLLATPDLAGAPESERSRRFLDRVPIAILVSEMRVPERVVYANPEFEKVSGQAAAEVVGKPWGALRGRAHGAGEGRELAAAIVDASDFVGTFELERAADGTAVVDAYSNVIEDDDGTPSYRLAALVQVGAFGWEQRQEFEQRIREKDILLSEVQHRVKNNLQMIAALMRIEARNARGRMDTAPFDRLAGRIEAVQLLYALLSDHGRRDHADDGRGGTASTSASTSARSRRRCSPRTRSRTSGSTSRSMPTRCRSTWRC